MTAVATLRRGDKVRAARSGPVLTVLRRRASISGYHVLTLRHPHGVAVEVYAPNAVLHYAGPVPAKRKRVIR